MKIKLKLNIKTFADWIARLVIIRISLIFVFLVAARYLGVSYALIIWPVCSAKVLFFIWILPQIYVFVIQMVIFYFNQVLVYQLIILLAEIIFIWMKIKCANIVCPLINIKFVPFVNLHYFARLVEIVPCYK